MKSRKGKGAEKLGGLLRQSADKLKQVTGAGKRKSMQQQETSHDEEHSFLDYIINNGYVSDADADAVRVLQESRFYFGVIALRERIISIEQLEQALNMQETETPKRLIGEIMIELGYLTREQVDVVLEKKKFTADHQADLLIDIGMMTPVETRKALQEYRNFRKDN